MKNIIAVIAGLIALTGSTLGAITYFTPRSLHEQECIKTDTEIQGMRNDIEEDRTIRSLRILEREYGCMGYGCRQIMPTGVWMTYASYMDKFKKLTGYDYAK